MTRIVEVRLGVENGQIIVAEASQPDFPEIRGKGRQDVYRRIARAVPEESPIHIIGPRGRTRTIIPARHI